MVDTKVIPDDLIDIETAAKLLFVSTKTIANWISEGRLRRFKAGARTLVSKADVMGQVREVASVQ
jgi:excisionase family DNA binding protein